MWAYTGEFQAPLTCKVNTLKLVMAAAFAKIEGHDLKVDLILSDLKTKQSICRVLHNDMDYAELWGAKVEVGDVTKEFGIFLFSKQDDPWGVIRIDLE